MKKKSFIVLLLVLSGMIVSAQETCKVLVKGLQGTYTGGCKKGLANGKGTAVGVDNYTGYFKKGLPNGEGTYIWASGEKYIGTWHMGQKNGEGTFYCKIDGRDTALSGLWTNDKYNGPKPVPPKILAKTNIQNIGFSRTGDGDVIYISIFLAGGSNNSVSNVSIFGSSGNEFTTGTYRGFEKVDFPFKCRITYTTRNAFRTGVNDCVAEFVITQPGRWDVRIMN